MAVVENLEDMWVVSKLQRDRKAKEEAEKQRKLQVGGGLSIPLGWAWQGLSPLGAYLERRCIREQRSAAGGVAPPTCMPSARARAVCLGCGQSPPLACTPHLTLGINLSFRASACRMHVLACVCSCSPGFSSPNPAELAMPIPCSPYKACHASLLPATGDAVQAGGELWAGAAAGPRPPGRGAQGHHPGAAD